MVARRPRSAAGGLRAAAVLLAGVWCLGAAAPAGAQDDADATLDAPSDAPLAQLRYTLGALVSNGPDYAGGSGRKTGLRPAWAVEHGRFRLSTSRGSAFMGHGLAPRDSGASATLAQGERFSLGASLRIDKGRDAADAPRLAGLPAVRSTLRARLSAGYALAPRWSVGAGLSQDLLGRGGGAQLSGSLGYVWPLTEHSTLSLGAGASLGDAAYLRSHFGVPAGSASPLPAFAPRAGLYSVDAGVELMSAIDRHWVVLGALRVSQLQRDARRSPLTVQPTGYAVSVGLAYRCC